MKKRRTNKNPFTKEDEKYMKRALQLAQKGKGSVSPNPLVGAVIVKNNKIIGEGWHKKYGMNHAEINAIQNCAQKKINGATLYVNLEPCCIYGNTPPCTETIIRYGFKRVVVAIPDPNPKVNGKGIKILRRNNIKVDVGLMKKEANKINEFFITFHKQKRPFIISKWAMGVDGTIATSSGESKWISSKKSREYVHKIRSKVDAIIVGINTVLKDNPLLNVRLIKGNFRNPKRIILDSRLRIPLDANCLKSNTGGEVIIVTTESNKKNKMKKLEKKGAKIIFIKSKNKRVNLLQLMKKLKSENILSCLIEGGSKTQSAFFNEGLVDKIIAFISPKIVGGGLEFSPLKEFTIDNKSNIIKLKDPIIRRFENDICFEGYIQKKY